jgi:hypothetical protein
MKKKTITFQITIPNKFSIFPKDFLEYDEYENGIPKGALKVVSLKQIEYASKQYKRYNVRCEIITPKMSAGSFHKKSGVCYIEGNKWNIFHGSKKEKDDWFSEHMAAKNAIADAGLRKANMGVKGYRL